jgi:hypothetical protein
MTRELLQNAAYFMATLDIDKSAVLWEQADHPTGLALQARPQGRRAPEPRSQFLS